MSDIIVFGATGYTGRLVTEYLVNHPKRSSFTLGICVRSRSKVAQLSQDLNLDDDVKVYYADVMNREEVDAVVKEGKVVINTIGPFWRWGTVVTRACAENGTHYVDISGEPHWIYKIIIQLDYLASKTHAIIIPASGFDSVPSDLAVYLGNKTIKTLVGPDTDVESSISGFDLRVAVSGGSIRTAIDNFSTVPRDVLVAGHRDYALSTGLKGPPSPLLKLSYTMPFSYPPIHGGQYIMTSCNRAIVQRTWGINQMRLSDDSIKDKQEAKLRSYGPDFKYEEFMVMPSQLFSVMLSIGVTLGLILLMFPPFRWLASQFVPPSGEGPSKDQIKNGYLHVTNVTSSVPTPSKPQVHVRTVIHGKGDAGYALAAVMISESALALLLSYSDLPEWVRDGGVFTPASALGDVLIKRLEESGRMTFESEVISETENESRKSR